MKTRLKIAGVAVLAVIVGVLLFPNGCSQPEEAMRVLSAQGYTEIEITGWRPTMAGEDDVYSTGFRALSPNGTEVTGAVTSGMFKGHTIRLD